MTFRWNLPQLNVCTAFADKSRHSRSHFPNRSVRLRYPEHRYIYDKASLLWWYRHHKPPPDKEEQIQRQKFRNPPYKQLRNRLPSQTTGFHVLPNQVPDSRSCWRLRSVQSRKHLQPRKRLSVCSPKQRKSYFPPKQMLLSGFAAVRCCHRQTPDEPQSRIHNWEKSLRFHCRFLQPLRPFRDRPLHFRSPCRDLHKALLCHKRQRSSSLRQASMQTEKVLFSYSKKFKGLKKFFSDQQRTFLIFQKACKYRTPIICHTKIIRNNNLL